MIHITFGDMAQALDDLRKESLLFTNFSEEEIYNRAIKNKEGDNK